jgi:hypothetical protein
LLSLQPSFSIFDYLRATGAFTYHLDQTLWNIHEENCSVSIDDSGCALVGKTDENGKQLAISAMIDEVDFQSSCICSHATLF